MTNRNADTDPPPTFTESEPPSTKHVLTDMFRLLEQVAIDVGEAKRCAKMAYAGGEANAEALAKINARLAANANAIMSVDANVKRLQKSWESQFSHEAKQRKEADAALRTSLTAVENAAGKANRGGE